MTVEERTIEQAAIKESFRKFGKNSCESPSCLQYKLGFIVGAKSPEAKEFHTKGMYSEEEVHQMFQKYGIDRIEEELRILGGAMESFEAFTIDEWFELNKKK